LFRDFEGSANWRPPHPDSHYTLEFWFVKLTIRYIYITHRHLPGSRSQAFAPRRSGRRSGRRSAGLSPTRVGVVPGRTRGTGRPPKALPGAPNEKAGSILPAFSGLATRKMNAYVTRYMSIPPMPPGGPWPCSDLRLDRNIHPGNWVLFHSQVASFEFLCFVGGVVVMGALDSRSYLAMAHQRVPVAVEDSSAAVGRP